jgi:hypothetical protein
LLWCVLQVLPLPDELLLKHATLYEDYKNTTHWPKHVLVHYRFHDEGDVDFNKGLYVLLATGGCFMLWCVQDGYIVMYFCAQLSSVTC